MMSRFSVEQHLEAVEVAITAFRWARTAPESHAGKVYLALKDLAASLRERLPEPSKVVLRS